MPRLPAYGVDGGRTWTKTRETVESVIGRYPGMACGVALLAGIAVGWWIKRR